MSTLFAVVGTTGLKVALWRGGVGEFAVFGNGCGITGDDFAAAIGGCTEVVAIGVAALREGDAIVICERYCSMELA